MLVSCGERRRAQGYDGRGVGAEWLAFVGAAGVSRLRCDPVRILHDRNDRVRNRAACAKPRTDTRGHPHCDRRKPLPLLGIRQGDRCHRTGRHTSSTRNSVRQGCNGISCMNSPTMNRVDSAVGLTMSRLEALEKANGGAVYTEDMVLPGMLHGALVLSTVAHARIVRYEISAALAVPGVKAVLTGDDFELRYMGLVVKDETVLAKFKVRYIGEPVAAVAAIDAETARAAARLVKGVYDELPAVFTIEEAIAAGAPVLHEEFDSYVKIYDASTRQKPNELALSTVRRGDITRGFAESEIILDQVYETSAQYHAYLEPGVALASVDGRGKVTVWSSTQSVFRTQANVHESLGIPMAKIRPISPRVGADSAASQKRWCSRSRWRWR